METLGFSAAQIKQRGRLGGRNYEAFSSPPLHTSIHVLGSPLLSLWIIVPCKDTALHVMLLDEDPR